jgi:hypothetical protein
MDSRQLSLLAAVAALQKELAKLSSFDRDVVLPTHQIDYLEFRLETLRAALHDIAESDLAISCQ